MEWWIQNFGSNSLNSYWQTTVSLFPWPPHSACLSSSSDIIFSCYHPAILHCNVLYLWLHLFISFSLSHHKCHLEFINQLFTSLIGWTHLFFVTSSLRPSQSRCLSLGSTTNVWPSCSPLYYSALCVSRYHQTCMPDMMHWLCLIIEMLNKYLQMADSSSPAQAQKCSLWTVSYAEETTVIVSIQRLSIKMHACFKTSRIQVSGAAVLTHASRSCYEDEICRLNRFLRLY